MAKLDISRIRCITFDLDDTLWHCSPTIIIAEKRFYEWTKLNYPLVTKTFSIDQLKDHRIQYMKTRPDLAHDLTTLRKNWMMDIANALNVSHQWIEEGFEIYWLARNEVNLFEGVETTLLTLKERFITGSITNGNADIHHIGLTHLFDFDVTSIESGAAKPSSAPFSLAANKAGVSPHEMLHVGDHRETDVQGALNAGMQAVWLSNEFDNQQSEIPTIKAVTELLHMFKN